VLLSFLSKGRKYRKEGIAGRKDGVEEGRKEGSKGRK
jgi:hypothetical protein